MHLTRSNFGTIFPFLYFDLTKQKMDIRDGITQLMFKCELSGITSTKYTVYALVLNEQEMKLRNENSKLILSA